LPLWLVLLIALLAAITLLNHFVLPGMRWFLRYRINRVIEEVNARIRMKLPTFQLTKREVLVDRLVYDPDVMATVAEVASERGVTRDGVMGEVVTYAREMVPAFNAYFYFKFGYRLARRFLRLFYRVRMGWADKKALEKFADNASVVFFINHRSNMDYLLVTYLASRSVALSYGAGEWARIWPFSAVLRMAGAYIVRRDASGALYRKVLERYVQMATRSLVPHAIFAEGQLSRNGGVNRPKLGLLGYVTKNFDPQGDYDILFVPVGTNFDRVAEERTLIAEADTDFRGRGALFVLGSSIIFLLNQAWRAATGRWLGFGMASASFGEPVSLKAWAKSQGADFRSLPKAERFALVEKLGLELMGRVAEVIPVLAVPLIATVALETDRPLDRDELKGRTRQLMLDLAEAGAHIGFDETKPDEAIERGLKLLEGREIIVAAGVGALTIAAQERPLMEYYARSIAHLMPGKSWTPPDV